MDSGMISKIQKAKRYAEEPQRVTFSSFSVAFAGDHSSYQVTYDQGTWTCECEFFKQRGICSHTMALERLLDPMVRVVQPEPQAHE